MNKTPETDASAAKTFVLAGRDEHGTWQKIETASPEADETADDVKAFLQTMGHANSRNFLELDVMTEAEFLRRNAAA